MRLLITRAFMCSALYRPEGLALELGARLEQIRAIENKFVLDVYGSVIRSKTLVLLVIFFAQD
jgi:hypothetical protein